MAVHVYALTSEEVIGQLTNLHNMFGMTIWVTEFACQVRVSRPSCLAIDRITL